MKEKTSALPLPVKDQVKNVLDLVLGSRGPVTVTEVLVMACKRDSFEGACALGAFLVKVIEEHNRSFEFLGGAQNA